MKHLLNSVNLIISKYKEIEKITGEHYNIFSVMGMENSEVKTHSAIIGDLLNANGSHFMGDVFLKLFIETVQRQSESQKLKDFKFETEHSNCLVEEFKGKKNNEEIRGGRIDLVIKDAKGEVIVIENKIFAPEQENQIQRYKNEYPDGMMLFLTLDGKDSVSAGNLVIDEDYHLICYKKTIINWLELCLKETFNQPILRETLKQYIVLIKKLTNQSTNKDMSEEIIKIMDENFEASAEIYKNFEKAIEKRQSEILTKILKTLNEETQGWKIELGFFKDSNCLFLNKENVQIRYRIKNSKHSVVNIEGINSLNEKLKSLGFDDSKMTKSPKYYWIQKDYHMDINALVNPQNKEGEITQLLKNIIKSLINKRMKLLYIHGLNSDATSRKYLNLKEYFQGKFEFDCLEWKNENNISELLDQAELKLENEINPILFGDSTGANFAWQLRERRRKKGKNSILILSSPLLDVSKRIAEFEFPRQLKTYLNKIEYPTDAMLIVPTNDELIEHAYLWENELENINLLKVEDTHRLPNFKDYLSEIERYISIKTNE